MIYSNEMFDILRQVAEVEDNLKIKLCAKAELLEKFGNLCRKETNYKDALVSYKDALELYEEIDDGRYTPSIGYLRSEIKVLNKTLEIKDEPTVLELLIGNTFFGDSPLHINKVVHSVEVKADIITFKVKDSSSNMSIISHNGGFGLKHKCPFDNCIHSHLIEHAKPMTMKINTDQFSTPARTYGDTNRSKIYEPYF